MMKLTAWIYGKDPNILSPHLFNVYAERILREALVDDKESAIQIGGRQGTNLRCADDTTLMDTSSEKMENLTLEVKTVREVPVLD